MPSNATDEKTDGNIGGRLSDYSLVQDQSIKPGLERGRAFLLRAASVFGSPDIIWVALTSEAADDLWRILDHLESDRLVAAGVYQ